jgi:glutamate synthase domain-containing protein 2
MVWEWMNKLVRGVGNEGADDMVFKMMKDKYTDNMLMVLSVMKRTSFFNAMEIWMRATQGQALERPLGTHLRLSPWELLALNPVHLCRFPVEDGKKIDTGVTIGPLAEKPLELKIPVYITGMSYGSALSKAAKVALAKAASKMGTATNTGEAGLLPAEREAADKLIGQFNRGGYLNTPDKYKQLDAVEIQLGQGAQGASPQRTQAKFIDEEMREVFGLEKGQDAVLHTRIPGVNSVQDFRKLVKALKEETGVPVGVKIAASHYLEDELDIAVHAGVDFVTVDGGEGATHAASPTAEDHLGLPTIYAIARARRYLNGEGQKGRVSLLAGGGLFTPGHFLKALALGADAVYIGTTAVMAIVSQQMVKVAPTEPPTQLVLHAGRFREKFDADLGAKSLVNFLKVSMDEITAVMYALGKPAIAQLDTDDLCCLDPWVARALHLAYGGVAPSEQEGYYRDLNVARWNQAGREEPQMLQ